jgi:RNA polymerase sigma factor (sigma-70 family)
MVLGVCRRLLADSNDCDDAFQATFLVLIRKAHVVKKRELLAHWLYGVAYRTALKARSEAARRRAHERQHVPRGETGTEHEVIWRDLRPILDEELNRLPNKYRVPIVLCYLEGKTFEEAARLLGWPSGTVSGRLARARELLRGRLARRGLALSTGILGTFLSQEGSAAIGPSLSATTLTAVTLLAPGKIVSAGLVSASVISLMEGVLQAMFMTKVKIAAIVLLGLGVLGAGGGVVAYQELVAPRPGPLASQTPGNPTPAVQPSERKEEDVPKVPTISKEKAKVLIEKSRMGDRLKKLLLARFEAAYDEFESRHNEFLAGRGTLDFVMAGSRRLLDSERELTTIRADQLAAYEAHSQRMKEIYDVQMGRFNAGRIPLHDVKESEYYWLEAEIWVERVKAGMAPRLDS